jgi:hypothetical protein
MDDKQAETFRELIGVVQHCRREFEDYATQHLEKAATLKLRDPRIPAQLLKVNRNKNNVWLIDRVLLKALALCPKP